MATISGAKIARFKDVGILKKGFKADHCCPNLNLDGIGTGSYKGFDFEILLQGFEEQFDLPPVLINGSNGGGSQRQVIGEKNQDFVLLWIIDLNPSQRIRAFLYGLKKNGGRWCKGK